MEKIPAPNNNDCYTNSRRNFLKQSSALLTVTVLPGVIVKGKDNNADTLADKMEQQNVALEINGKHYELSVEPRTTILDLL